MRRISLGYGWDEKDMVKTKWYFWDEKEEDGMKRICLGWKGYVWVEKEEVGMKKRWLGWDEQGWDEQGWDKKDKVGMRRTRLE